MRVFLLLSFCAIAIHVHADSAIDFLGYVCLQGFKKTDMPKSEAQKFCGCVQSDIAPRLSKVQKNILVSAWRDLSRGNLPKVEMFASTGVRDLVVAAEARCEAAFYPPSEPINIHANGLDLTLRCENEVHAPEAFVYIKNGKLLTDMETDLVIKKMMDGNFDVEQAKVTTKIDNLRKNIEFWDIDITGQIVSPPSSYELMTKLRSAKSYEVTIERSSQQYRAIFYVANKIPARWTPCGGVSR